MIIYFVTIMFSLIYLWGNLDKKLLMLLSLEISFLSITIFYIFSDPSSMKLSNMIFLLASMMVIDSVFSLSILISCGRSSGTSLLKLPIF